MLLLVMLIAALVAWTQRRPIVDDLIADQLANKDVPASYDLERVGLRTQRIRNLRLGDPADPDLVADFVELKTRISLFGEVSVYRVKARGVRARARLLEDGTLTFGAIDRLLPEPSGKPFTLPDLSVDLADSRLALITPYGPVGIAAHGVGNLSGGFKGKLAASAPDMEFGACESDGARALLDVAIAARRISLDGPVRAAQLACGKAFSLAAPIVELDATVSEGFDRFYDSRALLSARRLATGGIAAGDVRARLTAEGPLDELKGQYRLRGQASREDLATVRRLTSSGAWRANLKKGTYLFEGRAAASDAAVDAALLGNMVDAVSGLRKTPLEPIGAKLARALQRNLAGFDADLAFRVEQGEDAFNARLTRFEARADAGARLALDGIAMWDGRALRMTGPLRLSGGDLPQMRLILDDPPGPDGPSGILETAPYTAGNASIDLDRLRFRQQASGTILFNGRARLSGPFSGGRIEGVELPLAGRIAPDGSFRIAEGCTPVAFRSLRASGLRLGPGRMSLCAKNGAIVRGSGRGVDIGFTSGNIRLRGQLGGNPFALDAERGELVGGEYFRLANVNAVMGSATSPVRLTGEEVKGTFDGPGVNGTIAGGTAIIGDVPLELSEILGIWQVIDGELSIVGDLTVSDRAEEVRFYPLISEDVVFTLIDDQIEATGSLLHPYSGRHIMDVAIHHSLDTGLGEADLKVPGIRFDEGLQPEELTPLTQGVIALVTADVEGVGRIAWGGPEVVSTGTFDISDADFAASFGPVEGLDTRIVFTDLLNLVTGPGQRLTVDLVNPGIPVNDGVVTYQLLPGQLVKVERGLWPFMGGQLILRETILNFGAPADKRLTFELIAFDSALFVERLEFDNTVRMTGIFDGVIPTIFDEDGGRLVGGRLDAREGGGTIEYVGSLGKLSLGPRLAASVLRSIAYEKMIVRLDGDLDGEFATRMDIDGVRLGETTAARIVRQVSNIPVNLNVTISGPFRALIATMRSFDDPKPLIADVLPGPLENIPDALIETRRLRHEKDSEPAPDRAEDQPLPDVRKEDMP
ncbi:intermembrane phospholipid transport protein YdbH family protein [Sphingomicrobium lutaoense]|uniref:Dicarboxylate transport n=1 Tax=Sphingomicrobium lutaoense TaxID=515949 RepID=A0A839Z3C8_9SPHN|nr:YdbH domain-containing protein [Sphingomicrobium lutaoense]MBB3764075.1 hypothetical protein [Sphingomicrobium lutaoense]